MRDGGGREETAASSGDDRSVRERRSVVRRRRTTGENNDLGGEGKHAAQVHLTALLPQPPEIEKVVRQERALPSVPFVGYDGGKPVCILLQSYGEIRENGPFMIILHPTNNLITRI